MKKTNFLFSLLLLLSMSAQINAQEFNFTVKVVNLQTRVADPKVFQSLEAALKDLINTTKWTDDIFEQNERIEGTLQLTIREELSATSFRADLAITAKRPIYGSDQTTPLFVHLDAGVAFSYEQFQPLQFNPNAFGDNLTATIGYYAYVILGYDYDSFSQNGGETFWQRALDIYNLAPDKSEWKGRELGNQNRYWFVENVLSPRLKNFRQGIYEYHRLGLDNATTDMTRCRNAIMQCLEHMDEAQQNYPNTRALRTFSVTKMDELIEIFKAASSDQKQRFIQIMQRIDPANASRFLEVGF